MLDGVDPTMRLIELSFITTHRSVRHCRQQLDERSHIGIILVGNDCVLLALKELDVKFF